MPHKALWRVVRIGYLAVYGVAVLALFALLFVPITTLGNISLDTNLKLLMCAAVVAPIMMGAAADNTRTLKKSQEKGWHRVMGATLVVLLVLACAGFLISMLAATYQWALAHPQDQPALVAIWAISAPLLVYNLGQLVWRIVGGKRHQVREPSPHE
jgi:amino acid transporter